MDVWKCPVLRLTQWSLFNTVFLAKLVDTPRGINNFLLSRIKRVTLGAHINVKVISECGARFKFCTATANYRNLLVLWMNIRFHT